MELFFKRIKQRLRIKRVYGTSENAVKTHNRLAVPVYLLVAIIRQRLGWWRRVAHCCGAFRLPYSNGCRCRPRSCTMPNRSIHQQTATNRNRPIFDRMGVTLHILCAVQQSAARLLTILPAALCAARGGVAETLSFTASSAEPDMAP